MYFNGFSTRSPVYYRHMTWNHLTYHTKLRWNSKALKRLNFPCHASWKANHLPYSTVLRIEICDPCNGMIWFGSIYILLASDFIGVWHWKTPCLSHHDITMTMTKFRIFLFDFQHHSMCFRKQLINTGSGVSFDSFVASVGGWEAIAVVLWQCPFWKVITRKAFGNPGLVTHWYHSEGSIPKKTPLKRQFLIPRQAFWKFLVHHIWLTLLLLKQLDALTLIQLCATRTTSAAQYSYIHSIPSHTKLPPLSKDLHPHTLRGLNEAFRFKEATQVQAQVQQKRPTFVSQELMTVETANFVEGFSQIRENCCCCCWLLFRNA